MLSVTSKTLRLVTFALVGAMLCPSYLLAAPTQFNSPNYSVESVIFGGTGTLRASSVGIPPIITAGPNVSNVSTTDATVQWTTDKATNGLVFIGTTSGIYTLQAADPSPLFSVSHTVVMTFLSRGTQYFYKVRSTDINGNVIESAEKTFTSDIGDVIPPVIIQGPSIAQNSASRITVTWTTDELSNSVVEYGIQDVAENQVGRPDELTLFHQISVTGLAPAQNYLLHVKSKDASGNFVTSDAVPFLTLAAASITDVRISDITLNSAIVQWRTSVPTTTVLNYGLTSKYGQTAGDENPSENHLVRLTSLVNGTTYFLRLGGMDAVGLRLTSDEYIFQTVVLPTISGFKVGEITSNSAQITWNSSSPIDTFVRYEIVKNDDKKLVGKRQATGDDKLDTAHAVLVTDLESGTEYSVQASGKDVFGNQAISPSVSFTTLPDHDPPEIQNLRSDTTVDLGSRQSVQVLVSFGLSEPGRAIIQYGDGASGPYSKKVETDSDLSTNKFLVIPGLRPGDSYHFNVIATDRSGNSATSPDYLVLAPTTPVSLLDLIFNQIKLNFGWLSSVGK